VPLRAPRGEASGRDLQTGPAGQTVNVAVISAVEHPGDPRLADYTSLTDMRLRTSLEAEHGLFVAEGEKVIRRAVAAGYPVRSILATADRLGSLGRLAEWSAPVYVVPQDVAEQLTGFRVHRGALASMGRRALPTVKDLLAGPSVAPPGPVTEGSLASAGRRAEPGSRTRIIVLEDLVDHANVGAIFRCAAALAGTAVVLSPRCADPLYRRAVKVSMGAVFAIPYARMTDWRAGLAEIRAAGLQLLALTPDQSAQPLDEVPLRDRVALMLGSEGDGLSSRWLDQADQAVCIPMSPGAMALGVDSLNVVAAAAIACHALMRDAPPADRLRARGRARGEGRS
jgi:tRNA G18 (ribose-2'-O)-methylase SpoU